MTKSIYSIRESRYSDVVMKDNQVLSVTNLLSELQELEKVSDALRHTNRQLLNEKWAVAVTVDELKYKVQQLENKIMMQQATISLRSHYE